MSAVGPIRVGRWEPALLAVIPRDIRARASVFAGR